MFSNKNKLTLNTVSVSLGCGGCRRSKLTSFFNPKPKSKSKPKPKPKPKPKYHSPYNYSSSTHCYFSETATSNFSPSTNTPQYWDTDTDNDSSTATVRGFSRVGSESLAVEKDSDDPYLDFRHSMLQMILEKEIYSKDDLKELLNCFLQLNSPYYHGTIIRAFTEIWNGVFSVKNGGGYGGGSSSSGGGGVSPMVHYGYMPRDF